MSLTATLNRPAVIVGIVGLAMIGVGLVVSGTSEEAPPERARLTMPRATVEIVATDTAAEDAVAVSSRLFASAPAVVVADASNVAWQDLAITTATRLAVPVLVDGPGTAAEVTRLGATSVLTFGKTGPYARARPVTRATAAREVTRARGAYDLRRPARRDVFVVAGSKDVHGAALTTARNAGATVVALPHGDPRTVPAAAKTLSARPKAPVIALGASPDLEYTLGAVRSGVEQFGGGYLALPGRTMVALYGHPASGALGVLGERGVAATVKRATRLAAQYRAVVKTPVVPTFEIIATVASAGAGKDKNYSAETKIKDLEPLIDAAEKAGIYVILDLQPGRTDFLSQAKRYASLLKRPHVGLALDPEWRLKPKQKHLRQIGSVSAAEINEVGDWLAALTRTHQLPQKVFVLHQFNITMIKGRAKLDMGRPELATVIHVDGQGSQPDKQATWRYLRKKAPTGAFWGWKNFYDEDKPTLTVKQTWKRVKPHPELISYQ